MKPTRQQRGRHLSRHESSKRKMQRWTGPGAKAFFIFPNRTIELQTVSLAVPIFPNRAIELQTVSLVVPTLPLQTLRASVCRPRPQRQPRQRTPRSQPIRAGASPPGGDGDTDDGGSDDDDGERVVQVPISLIRRHSLSQEIYRDAPTPEMVQSVRERGILEPLHVTPRGEEFLLLSGHTRLAAAEAVGLSSVPARIVDVPPAEEIRYLLEANRYRTKLPSQRLREANALEPFVRAEALARELRGLGADGSGGRGKRKTLGPNGHRVSRTRDVLARAVELGSGKQLDRLRAIQRRRPDLMERIDRGQKTIGGAFAELQREDKLKGLCEQAKHVRPRADVLLGDCREMLPSLAAYRFAAIITDPPYVLSDDGIVHERRGAAPLTGKFGKWDELPKQEAESLINFCAPEFYRVLRAGGALYLFPGDCLLADWVFALRRAGFLFPRPSDLAWVKSNPPPSVRKFGWRSALELILYARKPGRDVFNFLGDSEMASALTFPHVSSGRIHPTQKPVALVERLIQVSTNPGDEVLDPFAGSGTTGEAALRCGRHALLIERDLTFHGLATERLNHVNHENQAKPESEALQ